MKRTDGLSIDYAILRQRQEQIMQSAHALNTRVNYRSYWRLFTRWCEAARLPALPAEAQSVKDFATWCLEDGRRTSSVSAYLAAIRYEHITRGLGNPCVGLYGYLGKARRELKERSLAKAAITYEQIRKIARSFSEDNAGVRNRAMILLAFASGWRRSEVVALRYSDCRLVDAGIELFQASSKTDQTGVGRTVGIHRGRRRLTCPVEALRAWLDVRGDWDGPLFCALNCRQGITTKALHTRAGMLYNALKRALKKIGEDQRRYGAHSLRSGMITEAARTGASDVAIRLRTGHASSATLQRYIRPATAFDFNPLKGVL